MGLSSSKNLKQIKRGELKSPHKHTKDIETKIIDETKYPKDFSEINLFNIIYKIDLFLIHGYSREWRSDWTFEYEYYLGEIKKQMLIDSMDKMMGLCFEKLSKYSLDLCLISSPKTNLCGDIKFVHRDYFISHDKFVANESVHIKLEKPTNDNTLIVSHIWKNGNHPDPDGTQFNLIRTFLKNHANFTQIFYDYICLPQKNEKGFRSIEHTKQFKLSLNQMPDLFCDHPGHLLIIADDSYESRAWCFCEASRLCYLDHIKASTVLSSKYTDGFRYIGMIFNQTLDWSLHSSRFQIALSDLVWRLPLLKVTNGGDLRVIFKLFMKCLLKTKLDENFNTLEIKIQGAISDIMIPTSQPIDYSLKDNILTIKQL